MDSFQHHFERFQYESYDKHYAPFANTIKKLESIVHMEKDKKILHLKALLQHKTKQLEDCERMLINQNEYISHSHGELGKIFGCLRYLTPFTRSGTTLCFGPVKLDGNKTTLVQLLGKLAIQFSGNQENLQETMHLLEKGSSMLKECQDQAQTRNGMRTGYAEKNRKIQDALPPSIFSSGSGIPLPFSCPVCQAQFDQQNKVMMHLRLIHNFELKTRRSTNKCGQQLVYLPQHGWDFKCTKCTEKFALQEHLEIHYREAHSMVENNVQNY